MSDTIEAHRDCTVTEAPLDRLYRSAREVIGQAEADGLCQEALGHRLSGYAERLLESL